MGLFCSLVIVCWFSIFLRLDLQVAQEKERLIIEKKLKPKLDEIENLKLSLKYLQNLTVKSH